MSTTTQDKAAPMLRIPRSAKPVPTNPRLESRQIPLLALAGAFVAMLAVLLVGANYAGWMATTGRGSGSGASTQQPAEQADPTGTDTAEIKGWMTLAQVLDAYPVTRSALYEQFKIPADTPTSTELRVVMEEIEGTTLEVPALRTWLAGAANQ